MTQELIPSERDTQGARLAATVILLRDSADGPQVLLLRRAERGDADLRSGVWVFPGGVLDADDSQLYPLCDGPDDAAWSERLSLPHGGLRYAVAALRECFEEVGLLLARGPDGAAPSAQALAERHGMHTASDFAALCQRHGLRLDTAALAYHSHWLTPPGIAKRFDTRFFVARMPLGQQPQADEGEALELAWLTPAQALDPAARLKLLPVTRRTLQDLARFGTVQACLNEAASRHSICRQMPRMGRDARGLRPVLPDEWAWAEIGRLDPTGRGDVACDLQPLRAVRLSPRVQRITCANGSVMTGPGTNTYLIGSPGGDTLAVLDPGPDDAHTEAHLQAVLAAAGSARISLILTTHTHKDHSPAAQRLQALTGARVVGCLPSHPMWQDPHFAPDTQPQDGQRLLLGDDCTLRAVATPGHASNHVCWLLEEEQLLFTGDHVMQGSTVVINPPDGDMAHYLQSLCRLLTLQLDWLAPGHGFLMAWPDQAVQALIDHRLAREAKVAAALQTARIASASELVGTVYGDVPSNRHGIAERSLSAHLIHLAQQGRAQAADGGRWRWVD